MTKPTEERLEQLRRLGANVRKDRAGESVIRVRGRPSGTRLGKDDQETLEPRRCNEAPMRLGPIQDVEALVAAVHARATGLGSALHGERHWQCVGWAAALLARDVPGADREVAFLFALLHDSQRLNDDYDPQHGPRAAALARELDGVAFALGPERLKLLVDACTGHADGGRSSDPSTAVCWDADRLNLWRVGTRPDPRYLSTQPASHPDWIARGREISESRYTWSEVAAAFETDGDVAGDLEDGTLDPDEVPPDTEPWDEGSDDE